MSTYDNKKLEKHTRAVLSTKFSEWIGRPFPDAAPSIAAKILALLVILTGDPLGPSE